MPQSASRCRQTPVLAAALFSYCLEVVSAQVSLLKCHEWVISHFETKGTLFNFAVSFTNVRPLVGSYFTKIWAFFIKSTDTEQIVTKTRRVYFKLPWLRFSLFSYLDDNSLLYKLLMNDHCYKCSYGFCGIMCCFAPVNTVIPCKWVLKEHLKPFWVSPRKLKLFWHVFIFRKSSRMSICSNCTLHNLFWLLGLLYLLKYESDL